MGQPGHRLQGVQPKASAYRFEFEAMSSVCEICLDDAQGAGEPALAQAAAQAIGEVRRIEVAYSRYRTDSIVSRINAAAGGPDSVLVDDETASLLSFAAQLYALSDGLFDITSGVLRRVWDFKAKRIPTDEALHQLLPLIGWSQVEWTGQSIRLPRAGMEVDFGGFGKEYAADRAMAALHAAGQRHGYVNLGGDIRVLGPRADGSAWRFGIQHPRQDERMIASVELREGALATSGDYERYFEHEGRRYCHILDPRTGWPVNHWASVSVTAPACVAAGALSTIAMLKGASALDFLAAQATTGLVVDTSMRSTRIGAEYDRRITQGVKE
ncbi:MAG: FAD:protein FMN transferase [Burkholderiaceae bacterium]|nr:FAD:protein FMN transferase [Burkholderiaceae bacterium]